MSPVSLVIHMLLAIVPIGVDDIAGIALVAVMIVLVHMAVAVSLIEELFDADVALDKGVVHVGIGIEQMSIPGMMVWEVSLAGIAVRRHRDGGRN